jgi:hypothetical protein
VTSVIIMPSRGRKISCTKAQQLISAGGQIFRNSNLTGFFPTPTSVKDGAAPQLAHIVCSALRYFQIKAAPCTFLTCVPTEP